MIVRKLTCKEHEELGSDGWTPNWLEHLGFEPSNDFGVSHDILEHMVDKIGGAEGELMAFGAMYWVRVESGWIFSRTFYRSVVDTFAGNFDDIFNNVCSGNQTLKSPGKTYKLPDCDDEFWAITEAAITSFFGSEYADYKVSDLPCNVEEAKARIIGWMRKGYRKAQKYYSRYRLGQCEVAHIFDLITEVVRKNSKHIELGEVLTIRINFRTCEVTGYKDYPYE